MFLKILFTHFLKGLFYSKTLILERPRVWLSDEILIICSKKYETH